LNDAASILGLLADPDRIRVAAALVLGAATADEVRGGSGLDGRTVAQALARLESGGVITEVNHRYQLDLARLAEAARGARQSDEDAAPASYGPLRRFVREGRLVSIPAAHNRRLAVLEWLCQRFEPGRVYPERDVNQMLAAAHPTSPPSAGIWWMRDSWNGEMGSIGAAAARSMSMARASFVSRALTQCE
jgi:DNA-binding transcriptional ArsR family regulator